MTATVTYDANLRTTCLHLQSGSSFETDAPSDNKGQGARFSPTDLIATGLGACLITTMGIKAESMDLKLDGAKVEVTKVMMSEPRRIGKIIIAVTMPALNLDDRTKDSHNISSRKITQQLTHWQAHYIVKIPFDSSNAYNTNPVLYAISTCFVIWLILVYIIFDLGQC